MPGIIDSAPSCIESVQGAQPADDSADFVLQAAFDKCAGFMTFGPGTTYGEEGAAAATSYYVLTWVGILFMTACLVGWVVYERRRLREHVARLSHWLVGETRVRPHETPPAFPGAPGRAPGAEAAGPVRDPGRPPIDEQTGRHPT
jgi:hypothetical protein